MLYTAIVDILISKPVCTIFEKFVALAVRGNLTVVTHNCPCNYSCARALCKQKADSFEFCCDGYVQALPTNALARTPTVRTYIGE